MADYRLLKPFILKWEGGWAEDKDDLGGATNRGVTLTTFRDVYGKGMTKDDLRKITDAQWEHVFKTRFWDRWKADQIENQSVANMLVDWLWCSGAYAIKIPQSVLRVDVDGVVGPKTIAAVNKCNPETLFKRLKTERLEFLKRICKSRPQNKKFLKGWQNRVNALG